MRTYKIKLYPTTKQEQKLFQYWSAVRMTWNALLEQKLRAERLGDVHSLLDLAKRQLAIRDALHQGLEYKDGYLPIPERPPKKMLHEVNKKTGLSEVSEKAVPLVKLSTYDQAKYLPELRKGMGWENISAKALYQVGADLESSYRSFFELMKRYQRGEIKDRPQTPTWKTRNSGIAYGFANRGGIKVTGKNTVRLLGVGKIHARVTGIPQKALEAKEADYLEITRDKAEQWWLHIVYKDVVLDPVERTGKEVGINLGIVHFLTTSDGHHLENLEPLSKELHKIAAIDKALDDIRKAYFGFQRLEDTEHNRKLHNRKAWSSNRAKTLRKEKNKLLRKCTRIRRHMFYRAIWFLLRNYDTVYLDNFDLTNMIEQDIINLRVYDTAWGVFYKEIQRVYNDYKDYGKLLGFVEPQYDTQQCSNCLHVEKKSVNLKTRVFSCVNCGSSKDIDINNAENKLRKGRELASIGASVKERKPRIKKKPVQDDESSQSDE